jgi:hypothetical protein
MSLLHGGVDSTVIALWLGHADVRSTQPYIHADMTIKERALAPSRPRRSPPAATCPTTTCSPTSKASDNYADTPASDVVEKPSATYGSRPRLGDRVGIVTRSA